MKDISTLSPIVLEAAGIAEEKCRDAFARIDSICERNTQKMLKAFTDNRVSASHFNGSSGYGYDDAGRDNLDKIVATFSAVRMLSSVIISFRERIPLRWLSSVCFVRETLCLQLRVSPTIPSMRLSVLRVMRVTEA